VNEPRVGANVGELMKTPPSGYFIVIPETPPGTPDDLAAFVDGLLGKWKLLLTMTMIGGCVGLISALLMPSIYRAQALIAPVIRTNGLATGGALRQLSALANIDLGSEDVRKEESLATLKSRGFAREFIQANNLLPVLFPDRWDGAHSWRAGTIPPTLDETVKRFTNEVIDIEEDRSTGFVTVTVKWRSPQLAAQWANALVEMVNEKLRVEAIGSADRSLEYLNRELAKTNVVEIRQAIYRLTEQQVNNAMLANVQREYAYRFLDRAVAPERRFSPKRTVVSAVGAATGLFLGVLIVYVQRRRAKHRTQAVQPD